MWEGGFDGYRTLTFYWNIVNGVRDGEHPIICRIVPSNEELSGPNWQ